MSGPGAADSADTGLSEGRRIRWAGPLAFLVECESLRDVMALHARLAATPLPGQVEVLAAAETVTLSFTHRSAAVAGAEVARHCQVDPGDLAAGSLIQIDVVYDGEDLHDVSTATGLSPEALVRWHTGTSWIGAFGGFAPGFTYLAPDEAAEATGGPLDIQRRSSPRTAVPAGSVAIAGRFSAVYPRASPGGWQLIGRTDAILWDLDRPSPALVAPGDRVRYRAVRELVTVQPAETIASGPQDTADGSAADAPGPGPGRGPGPGPGPALIVEHPGLHSLLQDLGRAGHGDLGVPAAGAADAASARQANRVVGNSSEAAVIETLLGGLALRASGHHVLALAGAEGGARITPATTADSAGTVANTVSADDADTAFGPAESTPVSRPVPPRTPFALYDGEVLTLDEPEAGLRTYVAVRGGFDADAELGSRSTDTLSGLGPASLCAGSVVPVGSSAAGQGAVGNPEQPLCRMPRVGATTTLRVTPGPREDWFGEAGLQRLVGQDWEVGTQSNRIGVRLEAPQGPSGAPLERIREGELASEGVVAGALQVPPSGLPVLFLADHPVTGGYPVIAVVVPQDLTLAAQLPPGATVRFTLTTADELDAPGELHPPDELDPPDDLNTPVEPLRREDRPDE